MLAIEKEKYFLIIFLSLGLDFQTLYLRYINKCGTLFSMAMHLCNCKDIFKSPQLFQSGNIV